MSSDSNTKRKEDVKQPPPTVQQHQPDSQGDAAAKQEAVNAIRHRVSTASPRDLRPGDGRYYSNIDPATREGKVMLFNASGPGDVSLDDVTELEIVACYFIVWADTRIDDSTGEISEFRRTVLIDKNGRTFRTTSAHIPDKMAAAFGMFSPAEWKEGVKFRVSKKKSPRPGHSDYHDIKLV